MEGKISRHVLRRPWGRRRRRLSGFDARGFVIAVSPLRARSNQCSKTSRCANNYSRRAINKGEIHASEGTCIQRRMQILLKLVTLVKLLTRDTSWTSERRKKISLTFTFKTKLKSAIDLLDQLKRVCSQSFKYLKRKRHESYFKKTFLAINEKCAFKKKLCIYIFLNKYVLCTQITRYHYYKIN